VERPPLEMTRTDAAEAGPEGELVATARHRDWRRAVSFVLIPVLALVLAGLVASRGRAPRSAPLRASGSEGADQSGSPDTMAPTYKPPHTYSEAVKAMYQPRATAPAAPAPPTAPPAPKNRPHRVCPSSWPQAGFDAGQSYFNPVECTLTVDALDELHEQWSVTLQRTSPLGEPPAIVNGRVYLADLSWVSALDAASGRPIWKTAVASAAAFSPAVDGGRVFVAGEGNALYALDAGSGRLLWQSAPIPSRVAYLRHRVIAGGGRVYMATASALSAFDEGSGQHLWDFAPNRFDAAGPPALVGGTVVIAGGSQGDDTPDLFALDAGTGALLWSKTYTYVLGPPIAFGDKVVFLGGVGSNVVVANARDGVIEKTIPNPDPYLGGLSLTGNTLLIFGNMRRALDLSTGRTLWMTWSSGGGASIAAGMAWMCGAGSLTAVELGSGNGHVVAQGCAGLPAVSGGSLYVGMGYGVGHASLAAFSL